MQEGNEEQGTLGVSFLEVGLFYTGWEWITWIKKGGGERMA